jgi:hypothetical protein
MASWLAHSQPIPWSKSTRPGSVSVKWQPWVPTNNPALPARWRLLVPFQWITPQTVEYRSGRIIFSAPLADQATRMRYLGPPPPNYITTGGVLAPQDWIIAGL